MPTTNTHTFILKSIFSNDQAVVMAVAHPYLSVCHECTVAKRCKIGPRLLLITKRKSHTSLQMMYKSLTVNDLEG